MKTIKHHIAKALLIAFFFAYAATGFSQDWQFQKPDYKKIESEIKRKKSAFYYPKLFERYLAGDSTMTVEEKRRLYYGFIFQPEYSPYGSSDYEDSLNAILNKDTLLLGDYGQLSVFSDSLLKANPFDIKVLNYKVNISEKLNDVDGLYRNLAKMNMVIDAIISSGNGTSEKDAFYVIFVSNEYDLLDVFGLEFGGEQRLIGYCDFLKLVENEYGLEGLYFDVSASLNHLKQRFK